MKIYLKLGLLFAIASYVLAAVYVKQSNGLDSQALCLNGQPAFVYYQEAAEPASQGLIIYFMGSPSALYCGNSSLSTSLDSCVDAHTQFSSFWTSRLTIDAGMLTDNQYKSWGKVIFPHCDGSLFQGYAANPTRYKGKDLFFRGTKIIKSNLELILRKYNVSKLQNVVVAGSGLGAIGALTWARYIKDEYILRYANLKFEVILDSYPFFYNSFKSGKNEFQISLQNLMKLSNVGVSHPFLLCALRNEGQQQKCFDFQQAYSYTNFPILFVASQYDLFTISRVLEISCLNARGSLSQCSTAQREYIQKYRSEKVVALFRFVNFHENSFWSIACATNNLLNRNYASSSYNVRGVNANSVVNRFVGGERTIDFDRDAWPGNPSCSGV